MIYFRDLTEEDIDFIRSTYLEVKKKSEAQKILADHFGVTTRGIRK